MGLKFAERMSRLGTEGAFEVLARARLLEAEGKEIGPKTGTQSHCPQGHEYSPENTRLSKHGWRACRACQKERRAAEVEAKKQAGTYKPRGWGLQKLNAERARQKAEQP